MGVCKKGVGVNEIFVFSVSVGFTKDVVAFQES